MGIRKEIVPFTEFSSTEELGIRKGVPVNEVNQSPAEITVNDTSQIPNYTSLCDLTTHHV